MQVQYVLHTVIFKFMILIVSFTGQDYIKFAVHPICRSGPTVLPL